MIIHHLLRNVNKTWHDHIRASEWRQLHFNLQWGWRQHLPWSHAAVTKITFVIVSIERHLVSEATNWRLSVFCNEMSTFFVKPLWPGCYQKLNTKHRFVRAAVTFSTGLTSVCEQRLVVALVEAGKLSENVFDIITSLICSRNMHFHSRSCRHELTKVKCQVVSHCFKCKITVITFYYPEVNVM